MFFVLSGFVLAQGYGRARWNRRGLISYGAARFARIYPVYLFSLLIVSPFIIGFVFSSGTAPGAKCKTLASYIFLLQGWMGSRDVGWNTPAWSLSCEFFFYLILPLALVWSRRARRGAGTALLLCAALAIPLLPRAAGIPWTFKPILYLGEFLMGMAASGIYRWAVDGDRVVAGRGTWIYLSGAILGIAVVCSPLASGDGTILRCLNGMLVLGLAFGGGVLARWFSTNFAQYLGQASYSMYILHVPILWWYGNRGPAPLANSPGLAALVYLCIVVLISVGCFEWLEKPANRWIRSWFQ